MRALPAIKNANFPLFPTFPFIPKIPIIPCAQKKPRVIAWLFRIIIVSP